MHLLIFVQLFVEVNSICFVRTSSSNPLSVIFDEVTNSEQMCKLNCLKTTQCTGHSFTASTGKCQLLGGTSAGSCSIPIEYWQKRSTGCSKYNVTADYVPDQCLLTADLHPQYLIDGAKKICPSNAVEGEAVARLYIVSVIFPNGTHRSFANDLTMEIAWDQQRASFVIRYENGGTLFIDEPIYAATCAYIKDDQSNKCPCAPLPLEPQTAANYTDVTPITRSYPLDTCAGDYNARLLSSKNAKLLVYSATQSVYLRCRAGLWIQTGPNTATNYNAWEVSAGACYK